MTAEERMMQALSDMLEDGEALIHPIYGSLVQGGRQYYGYFGFTEDFLLVALVSGKTVTDTIRVPLDISSVKIKKNIFLNEHVIDISFNEGAPCRITAFPKVLAIHSQKENLPGFLSYLKSKEPGGTAPELNQINGIKIRRQYFNFILYVFLAMLLPIIPMIFILECEKQNASLWNSWHLLWSITAESLPMIGAFILPLLLLSVCSKYIFGKTIAVVEQKGLYLENAFIPWEDIKAVEYNATRASRLNFRAAYITVTVAPAGKREFRVEVSGFTLYGLRQLKKHLPRRAVRWAKGELAFTIVLALLPTVIFLLIALG
ncbi:MAG: hypothetical protein IKC26_03540 [Clostridia bacterium]|nr:hypothetical protein [Clostridia bacterium]